MSVIELFLTFLLVCNISRKRRLGVRSFLKLRIVQVQPLSSVISLKYLGSKTKSKKPPKITDPNLEYLSYISGGQTLFLCFFFNFCGVYDKLYMNLSLLWFKMYLHSSLTIVLQITQQNFS